MNAETEKIPSSRFLLLIVSFINGSVLLLSFMDNLLKQDSWLVIISGFVLSLPFVLTYAYLCMRFPGKTILEINELVFGKVFGWVVSLIYVLYFYLLLTFNLRDMADFYVGFVMPDEPLALFLVTTILVACFAVRKGIAAMSKVAIISFIFTVFTVVVSSLLLTKDMDMTNFLPVMELPMPVFWQGTHLFAALPILDVFTFMMFFPRVANQKKARRNYVLGVSLSALLLLCVTVRNTAVLGPAATIFGSNSYEAVRMINIADFISRIELLLAVAITLALFMKISVLFLAALQGSAYLLKLRTHSPLILPVAGLVAAAAYVVFDSTVSHAFVGMRYHIFYPLLVEFVLPPLTLLVAVIRKLPREQGAVTVEEES